MSQITTGANAVRIQGVPVDPTHPTDGQVLEYHNASGKWEPTTPGGAGASTALEVTPVTLDDPNIGEVFYISGDSILSLAEANLLSTSGAVGTYQGVSNTITVGGKVLLKFVAGLSVFAGDRVFLSDNTQGNVTNVEPTTPGNISYKLARVLDATTYDPLEGALVSCIWQPETPIVI